MNIKIFDLFTLIYLLIIFPVFSAPWEYHPGNTLDFNSKDTQILPDSGHTGSIMEYWYLPGLNSNADTGGMSRNERLYLNHYGNSSYWMRYRLNGMDISDPAEPGAPIIDMPVSFWDQMKLSQPGCWQCADLEWIINPVDSGNSRISTFATSSTGGPTFMPEKTLDREPAQQFGAPDERRHINWGAGGSMAYPFTAAKMQQKILLDGSDLSRHFITAGNMKDAIDMTALYSAALPDIKGQLIVAGQIRRNSADGAQWNYETQSIMTTQRNSALAQISDLQLGKWNLSTGGGFKQLNSYATAGQFQRTIENQIQAGDWPQSGSLTGVFYQVQLQSNHFHPLQQILGLISEEELSLDLRFENTQAKYGIQNSIRTLTYAGASYGVFIPVNNSDPSSYIVHIAPGYQWTSKSGAHIWRAGLSLPAELYFDSQNILPGKLGLQAFAGLTWQTTVKGSKWSLFTSHKSLRLTMNEVGSMSHGGVSGSWYSWNDTNLDGSYQPGEETQVLTRSGNKYHTTAANLHYPEMEEIATGYLHRFSQLYSLQLMLTGRWYRNLLQYRYPSTYADGSYAVIRPNVSTGYVYDRNLNNAGDETFELQNNPQDSYFASAEIQLMRAGIGSTFFMNVGTGAYFQIAAPPPGNGPQTNDIGALSESTSDPNGRLALTARSDYDRGYMINWLIGWNPAPGLTWTNILHYRDGEPIGDYYIVEGLNRGTVPVMDVQRAHGFEGVSRYTFYLTWDIRLSYLFGKSQSWRLSLDLMNIMDSRTELTENYLRDKYYRRPVESIPPRTFKLSVSTSWS